MTFKVGASEDGESESPWFNFNAGTPESEVAGYIKYRVPALSYLTGSTVIGDMKWTLFCYWKNLSFASEES